MLNDFKMPDPYPNMREKFINEGYAKSMQLISF